ncbi:MAG: hypothetical protein COU69_01550 [Candidatus Pacebacteria bacterium CG10_big_fil_rev_8_21_14_0_10_56_10]|nr:MAG: hypothetical protein COU69_01550 [Candidatus Pacebacteria bacterium CG10_big_fil_rev_8_21_14_0_10_56_10]
MTHLSTIIVHYNADELTQICLRSLQQLKTDGIDHQVVVVDNGSKEALRLPKALRSKGVEVIRSDSNLGFTGGNNLGLRHAIDHYKSDWVLLLNNDTRLAPDCAKRLLAAGQTAGRVGIVNPKVYFTAGREFHGQSYRQADLGKVLWYAGGSIDWEHVTAFHRGVDELDRGQFDQDTQTDFATGCCLLVSRQVLETIGLLDERFFLYLEDVEFSLRARSAGFEIRFCPQAKVWHDNAGSSDGAGSKLSTYYQTRNRLYFGAKYGGLLTRINTTRLGWRFLTSGSSAERAGAIDMLIGRMGKRSVV